MQPGQQRVRDYQKAAMTTADRGQLLLLFYDGALKFLRLGAAALERGAVAEFARHHQRAQAIIGELISTLDHRAGGQIAHDLERLYNWMLDHLTEANLRRSAAHVREVIRVLEIIAGAYRRVIAGADTAEIRAGQGAGTGGPAAG